jgi:hypothetical protein
LNCSQARTLLAAYRELNNGQMDTTVLEVHLSSCTECRAFLAQEKLVGERIRALPAIKLPVDAHTKLMKALAAEHTRYIQQARPSKQSIPVPSFLASHLKEHGREAQDNIAAFSTADTGPLPLIELSRKQRRARHTRKMNSFAIIGVAAAFLMTIMAGGLTSLVILANRGVTDVAKVAVGQISQLSSTNYTTATSFTHIVSAVGNRGDIYYTAYGDNNSGWMLAALDNQTKISTPLLSNTSTSPLLVLSSSDNWLIWLRFDLPQQVVAKKVPGHPVTEHEVRTWSLEATYLGTDPGSALTSATPLLLQKGTFDANTAPTWVHTPVEGVWSAQNLVLVTTLDKQGRSHLTRYTLDSEKGVRATELANINGGHILTSPTATSDGTSIYWSEEWMSDDNVLHSDIWTQKISQAPLPLNGRWGHQTTTAIYPFRTDGTMFHPQVVNDMLFLQNVKNATLANVAPSDPLASATPAVTATPGTQANGTLTARTNAAFYALPDQALQGTLQAFSALDDSAIQTPINDVVQAPQAGSRFLLWQNSNKGIGMYDAVTKEIVAVGPSPIPNNSGLLAVNGDTTIWTINPDSNANNQNTSGAGNTITFGMFSWPTRAPVLAP